MSEAPAIPESARAGKAAPSTEGMVLVRGGKFIMGDDEGFSHESPAHEVVVSDFYMDAHEVTNAEFARFVEATGYQTDAERWGWSVAYEPGIEGDVRAPQAQWWVKKDGADWRHPTGPGSSIEGKDDHPVVQVSWNDAQAYCEWAGKRLPTEAEWEYAASGGGQGEGDYPWGEEFSPGGKFMANTWQGFFPTEDSGADGHLGLSPVGSFPPNPLGIYDIAGNVWEWCGDWYDPRYYAASPAENPQGPASGEEKVMRGGSWMCSDNYCMGYRVSHRNKATPDSGLNNTGFRCVLSAEKIE